MNLMLALQKLNESLKLEIIEFWGKIEGYLQKKILNL